MATTLGTLLIELKAKTDQFEKGMKSAKDLSFTTTAEIVGSLGKIGSQITNLRFNNLNQIGKSLAIVGGIAVGTGVALTTSVIAVAMHTSDKMVEMGHSAEKAGMDIKDFTENAYAAKRAGVPIEDFTNAMSKLAKKALEAAEGNTLAQRAFKLAGTSATDQGGRLRATGDILNDIIKKYDGLTDKTLKAGLAQQIFGRGGATVVPFLALGAEQVEKYRKQADLLGIAFDATTLAAAKRFKGGIMELKAASEGATIQFTAGLLPALNDVLGSLTKVTGRASAMRAFGDDVGDAFKTVAKGAMAAYVGIQQLYLILAKSPVKVAENLPTWQKMIPGLAAAKMMFTTDPGVQKEIDELQKRYDTFLEKLAAGNPATPPKKEEKGPGTNVGGDGRFRKDVGDKEIEQLREKAQATLALAAAELQGEASVRATTAANEADAVILKIASKAAEERARIETEGGKKSVNRAQILKEEIDAAQKKYGATALQLTQDRVLGSLNESLNKSVVQQTRDAGISADAHNRMAEAIMQGGTAVQQATIINSVDQLVRQAGLKLTKDELQAFGSLQSISEIDAMLRKNGIKLSKDQLDAIENLIAAKKAEAGATVTESLNAEARSLKNAAEATRLLSAALGKGSDAEIDARAQIEANSYAIANNIDLMDARIKKMKEEIAAGMRDTRNLQVGSDIVATYDPQKKYENRLNEINAAVKNNASLTIYAEAAKRDAYRQEQEELDTLAMKTQKGAAGAQVALREWLRESKDWAKTTHESVTMVLQGFDSGFRNAFSDIIMGTKSVGEAFAEMGRTMLRSVVDALANMVAKWIETKLIMAAMKLFGMDVSADDPMAKAGKQIAANTMEAESYAGLAAATEFAYALATSAGNLPYAIEMAAVTLVVGEGLAATAAFDNGGIVQQTGLALVHQSEGVLTAPATALLQSVIAMNDRGELGHTGVGNYNAIGDTVSNQSELTQMWNSINNTSQRSTLDVRSNDSITAPITNMLSSMSNSVNPSSARVQPSSHGASARGPVHFGDIHMHGVSDPEAAAQRASDLTMIRVKKYFRSGGVTD